MIYTKFASKSIHDVNGDQVVDISDVNIVINVILGNTSIDVYPKADVDGNGAVDIADANTLINDILAP